MGLVDAGTVSQNTGKEVFVRMLETGRGAREIVEEEGLAQVRDDEALRAWVRDVLEGHPEAVERYRGGEEKLLGFLVGQVMKRSEGKADPRRVNRLLREALEG